MKCQKCNEKEATFFYEETVNGATTSFHLCADCAEEAGLTQKTPQGALGGLFDGVFPALFGTAPVTKKAPVLCTGCGASWSDVAKEGKVFCPQCYATFRGELSRTLRSLHGNVTHTGRTPLRLGEEVKKAEEKKRLKAKLEAAIAEENFEEAARLRDEIRALGEH